VPISAHKILDLSCKILPPSPSNLTSHQPEVKMVQTTQPVTATAKALGTPEIIANILVLLPAKDILISAPRVNHTFNTTIKEFPALRKKLFFSVDVTDAKGKGSSQKVSGGANTFFFPNQHVCPPQPDIIVLVADID